MVQKFTKELNNFFISNKEFIYKFVIKYITLINDFLNYSINNQNIDNINFFKNYIYHGLNSLTHIFKITLLRSGSIDYTYEITQKAFIDYNEFIIQINDVDLSHINLTTTDAIVFIYKRSIFKDIEQIKNNLQIHNIMNILNEFILIHNQLLIYYIDNITKYNNNFDIFTKYIYIFTESSLSINGINNINNINNILTFCIYNKVEFCTIIDVLIKSIITLNNKFIDYNTINTHLIHKNFLKAINSTENKSIAKFFKQIN